MRNLMELIGKVSRFYSGKVDKIITLLKSIDDNLEELNKKEVHKKTKPPEDFKYEGSSI